MPLDTPQALFEHELADVYDAEHALLDALAEFEARTENEELAGAFREHREETRGHVDRLEEVFREVGVEPEREECEGVRGLLEEHEAFLAEEPDREIVDFHNKMAAEKTEHYEIAAYGNLTFLAGRLGMDGVADTLAETLEEEEAALETLKDLSEGVAAVAIEG